MSSAGGGGCEADGGEKNTDRTLKDAVTINHILYGMVYHSWSKKNPPHTNVQEIENKTISIKYYQFN